MRCHSFQPDNILNESQGFDPSKVPTSYGQTLTFWDWKERKIVQQVNLGAEGLIPLETRFLHDPSQAHGFVGAALSSNIIHFTKVGALAMAPCKDSLRTGQHSCNAGHAWDATFSRRDHRCASLHFAFVWHKAHLCLVCTHGCTTKE